MNVENLTRLATYLEQPALKLDFHMEQFCTRQGLSYRPIEWQCGTVGCAVGHGPAAGIAPLPNESWPAYAERVFMLDQRKWLWCFSPHWSHIDNTAVGAAARIRYLLHYGQLPPGPLITHDATRLYRPFTIHHRSA